MPAITNPTPEQFTRTFHLVGEFMFNWAHLESMLNRSVGKILHIDSVLNQVMLTANMSVREKLNVLRTALLLPVVKDSDEWKALNKLVDRIGDRNDDRNVVAHTSFGPHSKGVTFYPIKAKREFAVPDLVWTTKEFAEKGEDMTLLTAELSVAVAQNVNRRRRPLNALSGFAPMTGTRGLGLLGLPLTPLLDETRSEEASPETSPQSDQGTEG